MTTAAYVWIGAMVLFAVMEAATVGLVSIWFIGGSLAALIAALFGGPMWLQILLFFVVSAALLVLMRPLLRKFVAPKKVSTNADRIIGQHALVTEEICNIRETGAIRINGVEWTARNEIDEPIPVGAKIEITRIEGAKVYVKAAELASAVQ